MPYLAAILLGAVWAADRRGGDGASQLRVGAQHRVGLSRASRTKFPNARWEFSSWMVLQNMGFALAGTLINLQFKYLAIKAMYSSTFLLSKIRNFNLRKGEKCIDIAPNKTYKQAKVYVHNLNSLETAKGKF